MSVTEADAQAWLERQVKLTAERTFGGRHRAAAALSPTEAPWRDRMCGHCGRAGARAWADGVHLCHPDDPALPDCYRRVTVYGEAVGALMFLVPLPSGVEGIVK